MRALLLCFLVWHSACFSWVKEEGFYAFKSKEDANKFLSHYVTDKESVYSDFTGIRGEAPYQLVWLESGMEQFDDLLTEETRVVVWCERYPLDLEDRGYSLLTHLVQNGEHLMVFLKDTIFNSWMYIAKFDVAEGQEILPSVPNPKFLSYLKPVGSKHPRHAQPPFDYIYMINLDERPEKFALSQSKLKPYGIYPHRFSAVHGKKLSQDYFDAVGVKFQKLPSKQPLLASFYHKEDFCWDFVNALDRTYYHFGTVPNVMGVILSHLSILYDAYQSNYKIIWVMEDDIEVHGNLNKLPHYIKKLSAIDPSWDILYTDSDSKDTQGNAVPCRSLALRPNYPMRPLSFYLDRFKEVSSDFRKIGMRFGTYSMIFSRSGIEKVLNYYKQYSLYLPYDCDYWLIPDLKMYVLKEPLVSTIPNAISDNGLHR